MFVWLVEFIDDLVDFVIINIGCVGEFVEGRGFEVEGGWVNGVMSCCCEGGMSCLGEGGNVVVEGEGRRVLG